jgi:hypothetical protein
MFERKARNYPRTSDIRRLVQAIRADGTIRLMPNAELRSADEEAKDEFDAWEKAGRL